MTEKIGLQATLETSQFEQGAKAYNAGIDAMEAANTEFAGSTDDVTEGLSAVDDATATTGKSAVELAAQMDLVTAAYDAVAAAVGEAIELADLGSQANRAEDRFRAFAGEIGDADELLAAFNQGAGGTVDKLTAMASAGRLLQMGLVQNNAEMEQVVEIATRLGDQTQSAGDRVSDFALLLANQSIPRLDNFGISSGKVRARIAELQAEFKGMSREAAFSQAVFEQGAKSLDILGVRTQDAGTKMEVARANIQNMRIEMGQKLLPIVAELFGFIANLNTKTLAMIAVLGGGVPIVIKLGVAFKTLATGMATSSVGAGTMALRMGVLAAAVVALVVLTDKFNNEMDEMTAAQDSAQEAAGTLGDQFTALVEDGTSVSDALAQMQEKIDEATQAFDDNAVTSSFLGEIFGANAAFADTLTESYDSLNESLAAGAPSYQAYVGAATEFNRANSEAPGRLEELNAELERLRATGLSTTEGMAGLAAETRAVQSEIALLTQGAIDGTGTLDVMTESQFKMAEIMRDGAGAASLLADEILKERLALDDNTTSVDRAFPILDRYNQNQERGASKAAQMGDAVARSGEQIQASSSVIEANAAALDARASMAEKVARIEDMQTASALAATAALEEKRKKDIEVVQAEQALAQSVLNASDAMIAQTFITGLDPEQMGLTAYRQAVEDIQLSFGLATPESIALAKGINRGIDAMNTGGIAADDMSGFISDLIADAKDGDVAFEGYADAMATSADESGDLTTKSASLGIELNALNEDANVAAGGLDATAKSVGALDDAMGNAAANAGAHGAAIAANLGSALDAGMGPLIANFQGRLQDLRNALPGSEPADTSSPLFGLSETGEAIVNNITDGINSAASNAVDAMFQLGDGMKKAFTGSVGALGGTAAGIFTRETVKPLQERTKSLTSDLDTSRKALEKLDKEIAKVSGKQLKELTPEEQIALSSQLLVLETDRAQLAERIASTSKRRLAASEELTKQEARVGRFRGAQERLKLLEQQTNLLDLLTEKGLDADAILGGIKLGVDAEAGDILDAMAIATEALVKQAEKRLAFGKELTAEEQKALDLQAAQARLAGERGRLGFIKQQADLMALIAKEGLDASTVLGGLELGLDASDISVLDAMTRATGLLVEQAEQRLRLGEEIAEQEQAEVITPLQASQERLRFLQQQIDLVEKLKEQGIDLRKTGGGLGGLGIRGTAEQFAENTLIATNAAIASAELALTGALDLQAAADRSAEEIFEAIGELESGAGVAGDLLLRHTIEPLKDTVIGLTDELSSARAESQRLAAEHLRIEQSLREQGDLEDLRARFAFNRSSLTMEQIQQFTRLNQILQQRESINNQIRGINQDIVVTTDELVAQQERMAQLARQQENLRFLEQQADLLELIAEKGLDAEAILGGLELGLDANVDDLIAAMSAAMEAVIAQAEEELGIASPSRVFEKIGGEAMKGMAMGIQGLMGLPVAQSVIATQAMIAAPAQIVSPRNITTDNSRSVGDINISGRGGGGQMGDVQLVATIRRVIQEEIRG